MRKHGSGDYPDTTRSRGAALSSAKGRTDGAFEMVVTLALGFRPRLWMGCRYATQEREGSLRNVRLACAARRAGVIERWRRSIVIWENIPNVAHTC